MPVTRYSVAKTQRSYDPKGVDACVVLKFIQTQDLRDCYTTAVCGDEGPLQILIALHLTLVLCLIYGLLREPFF